MTDGLVIVDSPPDQGRVVLFEGETVAVGRWRCRVTIPHAKLIKRLGLTASKSSGRAHFIRVAAGS